MNFHYEDDIISDLPSCVYASQQITNNQQGNLRMNSNSLRQIQQQYMHHSAGKFTKKKRKIKSNINKSIKTV